MSVRSIPVAVLVISSVLVSCSGDSTTSTGSAAVTTAPSAATPTDPASTAAPTSSASKLDQEEGEPAIEPVSILIDADSGESQDVSVALGTPMTIRVRSTQVEEFHLHGYDLELTGTDVTFTFVADVLGEFELETHGSGALVLLLTVLED